MANMGSFTIATIRRQLKPRINDAAYNDSPLLYWLKEKDCVNYGVGGDGFQSRNRNSTSAIGGSTDDFSIRMLRTTQPFGTVTRQYVKYVWNLMISLLQDLRNQNAGNEAQMFKMRMQQVNEVCQSAIARVVTHMYTGNSVLYTNDDSTPMDGLNDIISATNTYAGVDRTQAANAYWRAQVSPTVAKFTADTGNIGVNDGIRAMRATRIACSLGKQVDMNNISKDLATGKDVPDGIVTDATTFQAYGDSLAPQQRYAKSKDADPANAEMYEVFGGIKFTYDPYCPTGKLFFLNSRHMSLDIVGKELFNQIFDGVIPIPYTAHVFTLCTQGQFYSDDPRYLGVVPVTAY